jgi:hypothetical protein
VPGAATRRYVSSRSVTGPQNYGSEAFLAPTPVNVWRFTTAALCAAVAGYGVLTAWIVPLASRVHYDPSLQYLLSSLAWYRGASYAYVDHPGTPVEVVGTLLLGLTSPFLGGLGDGFFTYHLSQPNLFFGLAQTGLVLASLTTCALLAKGALDVHDRTHAALAVAISGVFFAVHCDAFASLAKWSHESFCFPAGTLLSFALLRVVRRNTTPPWRHVVALGFASGVLTAVQLYFAAWVLGTGIALAVAAGMNGAALRFAGPRFYVVCASAIVGFVVATLPIRDRYLDFVSWVWRLLSHRGIYGTGEDGFGSAEQMAANLFDLARAAPVLLVGCGVVAGLLVWRLVRDASAPRHDPGLWAAALGLGIQAIVIVFLASKHPGPRYLLPLAATLPLLLAVAMDGWTPQTRPAQWLVRVIGGAILVGFAIAAWSATGRHLSLAASVGQVDSETERRLIQLAAERGTPRADLNVLWTYGTLSPCQALWFGNLSASSVFVDDIGRLCPRDGHLNIIWNRSIDTSTGGAWDVAVIPEGLAGSYPASLPPGELFPSSIPSLGY